MKTILRRRGPAVRVLPVLVLMACASGCGGLSKPYPEKNLYALDVPGSANPARRTDPTKGGNVTAPAPATRPAPPRILQVRGVRIAKPYDGNTFVYKVGPSQFTNDYYNGFIAPPARLIRSALLHRLDASGLFDAVTDGSSAAEGRYTLETNVTALYGDYTDKKAPRAVFDLTIFFLEEDVRGSRLLLQRRYQETEAINGEDAGELAAAWARACGRAFDRLESDLQNHQPASGERAAAVSGE